MGDLEAYNQSVAKHSAAFTRDGTLTLVTRLRHNVIKTGLRKINIAYSRIGFDDICQKLRLDSAQDAEYIVAKAIKDGVIEARINHGERYVESKAQVNIYSTSEPYEQFHKRIEFCLNIRNDAVKAMRFPETSEPADVLKDEEKEEKKVPNVDDLETLDDLEDDE